jgi:hypothetical protein
MFFSRRERLRPGAIFSREVSRREQARCRPSFACDLPPRAPYETVAGEALFNNLCLRGAVRKLTLTGPLLGSG